MFTINFLGEENANFHIKIVIVLSQDIVQIDIIHNQVSNIGAKVRKPMHNKCTPQVNNKQQQHNRLRMDSSLSHRELKCILLVPKFDYILGH